MLATEHDSKQEGLSMQLHDAQQLLTVEHLAQVRTYADTCLTARYLTGTWKSSEGPLPRHASSFSVAHCWQNAQAQTHPSTMQSRCQQRCQS